MHDAVQHYKLLCSLARSSRRGPRMKSAHACAHFMAPTFLYMCTLEACVQHVLRGICVRCYIALLAHLCTNQHIPRLRYLRAYIYRGDSRADARDRDCCYDLYAGNAFVLLRVCTLVLARMAAATAAAAENMRAQANRLPSCVALRFAFAAYHTRVAVPLVVVVVFQKDDNVTGVVAHDTRTVVLCV